VLTIILLSDLTANVVKVIGQLLLTTQHDQIRRHSTFCLYAIAKTLPDWSVHCPAGLKETLEQNIKLLNSPEFEVGIASISLRLN